MAARAALASSAVEVWTGSPNIGSAATSSQNCVSWTPVGSTGLIGHGTGDDLWWSSGPSLPCASEYPVYCVTP